MTATASPASRAAADIAATRRQARRVLAEAGIAPGRLSAAPATSSAAREVRLAAAGGRQAMWSAARAVDLAKTRFQALLAEGMPAPEAARELGLERITAWRWTKQIAALSGAANFPARAAEVRQAAGEPGPAAAARLQAIDTPVEIAA